MKVLLVASRPLDQARRGDQLRAREIATALGDHELTVLAPGSGWRSPSPLESLLRLAGAAVAGAPFQSALVASGDLVRRVAASAPHHDLVVVMLSRLADAVGAAGNTPVLVDLVDALSLNAASRATVDRLALRALLRREASALGRLERRVIARANHSVVVCERDRSALADRLDHKTQTRLGVVPLAVAVRERPAEPVPRRIVLSGNLGYFVNRDAVTVFLAGPWPELAAAGFELVVVGDRPGGSLTRKIRAAGARLEESPADLGAWLATASVAVAPTRCGSGVPVKILEAWSLGVPVVASPFAAAGANLVDGETGLLASETRQWVDAVRRLDGDRTLARRLASGARARLEVEHAPARVADCWRAAADTAHTGS